MGIKTMENWKWRGGKLVGESRGAVGVSLSISEAWKVIPNNPEIARACHKILKPNRKGTLIQFRKLGNIT